MKEIISDYARMCWAPGLASYTAKPSSGVSSLMKTAQMSIYNAASGDGLTVRFNKAEEILDSYAYDVNRFSAAAKETVQSILTQSSHNKSLGWILIKLYYAAFFYAHAIIRISGSSLTYFERSDLSRIIQIGDAYGASNCKNLKKGDYIIDYKSAGVEVHFAKMNLGNSHEGLWAYFCQYLNDIQVTGNGSILGTDAKKKINERIKLLIDIMKADGANGGNWLSRIRNSLNYQQSHGVWYPYNTTYTRERIVSEINDKLLNDGSVILHPWRGKRDDIPSFLSACLAIIVLGEAQVSDIARRSNGSKSFIRYADSFLTKAIEAA